MFDLIVSGGKAVMPSGSAEPADIGVSGGKIAAIGGPGSLAGIGAARIVDAAGQIVMPGGVDPHIHCSSPIPFPGRKGDLLGAPPEQVSRAALHGGTTTLLDFAPCPPDQPLQQSIELRKREWAGACYCDYGFHLLLHGKLSQGVLDPLPEAIQDGHASVKMFTTDIRPNRQGRMVQFGDIWEVLKILGVSGGIAAIHAKDKEALWAATNHGAIQAVATDEVCCPLKVKLQGRRIDDTTGGNSGVEPRLSLMYTHMVEKRGYSLADFVCLTSTNAARIMGLYPRKGALAVGSDADIG